jgi:surface carbohydrate biosynthesis protein
MNLYLHIEILNREFHSKLLIAMESASRGMNVYLGRLKPYLMRDFFVPGIILDKSITPSPQRIKEMEYCKKKNFIYTSLDEEVGLIEIDDYYLQERYSNQSLKLADKVFCWGKWDYNNLAKKYNKYKKKFILSGNPRIDFWRKDFEFFYKKRKLKYNNYILFTLNFSHLVSKAEFNKFLKFLVETKYVDRGYTIDITKKRQQDSYKMYKKFSKLITTLAKRTDLRIIVRPHPTDPIKNYNFLKKYKNVSVTNMGTISEWIHYAKIVIHSGCTGGLESSIRGLPTVSYCPFNSSHGHKFADLFSKKTANLEECINIIQKLTKNELKFKKKNLTKIRFRAHNLFSKKPGYKIIVDELKKFQKVKKIMKKNNDLILKFKFKIRDFRSKILNFKYGNVKFSTFKKDETLKVFEILKELNPKYNDLSIDFIKKDIIHIKNKD